MVNSLVIGDTSYLERTKILNQVNLEFKDYTSIEKFIVCVILYTTSNTNASIVKQDLDSFKILNNNRYNALINKLLSYQPFITLEKDFLEEYSAELESKFFRDYNTYRYTRLDSFNISKKFNIDTDEVLLSKILLNLKKIDSRIITPIEDYYNTHFLFKRELTLDIKKDDNEENNLIKYGYATRFKFNLIDSYEIFKNIQTGIYNIDFGLCYLTHDGYIFITVPDVFEGFNTGSSINKLILT